MFDLLRGVLSLSVALLALGTTCSCTMNIPPQEGSPLSKRNETAGEIPKEKQGADKAAGIAGKASQSAQYLHQEQELLKRARNYIAEGKFKEAESLYSQLIAVSESVHGPASAELVTELREFANCYSAEKRFTEARPLFERALSIAEKAYGKDSAQLVPLFRNVANCYFVEQRFAEAHELFERALTTSKKAHVAPSDDLSCLYAELANVSMAQKHYSEAEPFFRQALRTCESLHGSRSSLAVSFQNALVTCQTVQGKVKPAEKTARSGLDAAQQLLQSAGLDMQKGNYAKAEPVYRRAVAITEKEHSPESAELVTVLRSFGTCELTQKKYAEAEPLYRRALSVSEKVGGAADPDAVMALRELAICCVVGKRYAEAELFYERGLTRILKGCAPVDQNLLLDMCLELGKCYMDQRRYQDAEPLFKRALAISEKVRGPQSPQAANCRDLLSHCLRVEGKYEEAEAFKKHQP